MFSTLKQKLLLGIYIFILLSIPVGAYFAAESRTVIKSSAADKKPQTLAPVTPKPLPSAKSPLLNLIEAPDLTEPAASPEPSSPTIATTYGPTLSLSITSEGRPADNQAAKIFIGIIEGNISQNPKFLLNFTIDLPESGKYSGLSLAGLNPGSAYTVLIKGPAQIAASSLFTMSPAVTSLNQGIPLNLISGDLNDDNVITGADYTIAQKATGSTIRSSNWNENADLNKDGVINAFDLGIISKNMGKIGSSGAWTSPLPKTATQSGTPVESAGTPSGGYWIWIPQ